MPKLIRMTEEQAASMRRRQKLREYLMQTAREMHGEQKGEKPSPNRTNRMVFPKKGDHSLQLSEKRLEEIEDESPKAGK